MTTIGIIGMAGKYGQWLKPRLEALGYNVLGSDLNSEFGNRSVVEYSDVVIFSVPPQVTCEVIESVTDFSREDQLWLDITSLKTKPVEAMLKSKASVIGLHPMCAPTGQSWKGQTVVACVERCDHRWEDWMIELLLKFKANVKFTTPIIHDKTMALVQVLPHFGQLASASTIRKMEASLTETLEFTSPFYRIAYSLMGRILAQNPELYFDIQTLNPYTPMVLRTFANQVRRLRKIIEMSDQKRFLAEFANNRTHFGDKVVGDAFNLFDVLNQTLANWSPEYTLVLKSSKDRPGLLADCLRILADAGINLTTIRSEQEKTPGHCKFVIGLDRKNDLPEVQEVVSRICEKIATVSV